MFPEFVSLSLFPWGFSLSLSVIKEVLHIHPSSPFVTISSDTQTQEEITQLLVSKSHRELLFQGTHHNPMIWHPGHEKTLNHLMAHFYWPGIHGNVRIWCAAYRECQLINPPATPKAPLHPLPLIKVAFEKIGVDLVGPLLNCTRASLCVSSSGLRNTIPRNSASLQYLHM